MSGNNLTSVGNGYYTLAMSVGNTDTLGRIDLHSNKGGYQFPPREFMVLPAGLWNALYANDVNTTGGLPAATGTITQLAGAIPTAAQNATAAAAAIGTASITYTGPVNPVTGAMSIIRGDDYSSSENRAPSWTVPFSGGNPDLTGATVVAQWYLPTGSSAPSAVVLSVTAAVTNAGTSTQTVTIQPTAANTALLTGTAYGVAFVATYGNGHVVTFMRQACTVTPRRG